MQPQGPLAGTGAREREGASRPAFEKFVAGIVLVVDRLVAVWDFRRDDSYPGVIGQFGNYECEVDGLSALEGGLGHLEFDPPWVSGVVLGSAPPGRGDGYLAYAYPAPRASGKAATRPRPGPTAPVPVVAAILVTVVEAPGWCAAAVGVVEVEAVASVVLVPGPAVDLGALQLVCSVVGIIWVTGDGNAVPRRQAFG